MKATRLLAVLAAMSILCAFELIAQEQMQDVVYLKNGSIIRGMIIEQVPNKSLKIKTKDGSVFVYTMEEVERITKEEAVQQSAGLGSLFSFGAPMVRGSIGTDITGGLGFGGGVAYVWMPQYTSSSYEFGLDFFYHESKEISGLETEKTKLTIFTGRANWLFNYAAQQQSVYFIAGFGFVVASIDWVEYTTSTGKTVSDFDGTSAGNVINLGVGWTSRSGFGARLETPLLFFYSAGQASAFAPTFTLSLAYRF